MNAFALHVFQSSRYDKSTDLAAARSESDRPQNGCWTVRFPTSSFKEEVEVLPYQSVLQRLQLPLDCLTFFINSQVILFPWQQFPADTKKSGITLKV